MTSIGRSDQEAYDEVLLVIIVVDFFAWLAPIALDGVRFRASHIPLWLQSFGAWLLLWARS
jgi:hypothetical protein